MRHLLLILMCFMGGLTAQSQIKDADGNVMFEVDSLGNVTEFGMSDIIHFVDGDIHDMNQDDLAHISGDTLYDVNNDVLGHYSSGTFYDTNNDVLGVFTSGRIEDQDGVLIATYVGVGEIEASYLLFFHLMF